MLRCHPLPVFDQPGNLMSNTIELLKEEKRSLTTIAEITGLPYLWIRNFKAGLYINPSVNRVEYLHNFLRNEAIQ